MPAKVLAHPALVEQVVCDKCASPWWVEPNMSLGVERLTTCQRCLVAEVARLTRLLDPGE